MIDNIIYVGMLEHVSMNISNLKLIFTCPSTDNITQFYIDTLKRNYGILSQEKNRVVLRLEVVEDVLNSTYTYSFDEWKSICKAFIIPSFFELGENTYFLDKPIIEQPGKIPIFIFLERNILSSYCKEKPQALIVSETSLHKIVDENGVFKYGYKDMFIAEAYDYIADTCKDCPTIIYIKNLYRIPRKVIDMMLNETTNMAIAVDLEELQDSEVRNYILSLHTSKNLKISFIVAIDIAKLIESRLNKHEMTLLQLLNSKDNYSVWILLKNAKPLVDNPLRLSYNDVINLVNQFLSNIMH
ncbi:MAG: hypothetical protein JHC33_00295 [Ignisphaera sp.]|nr:hypothetical protein [Ignisphaera sp.]